jgi:tRNA dimethylallyltransferase
MGKTAEEQKSYNLIVILGTTASGKTRLAANLAAEIGSEVISADSRQVYRGMDLGTGKDLEEFTVDGKQIPYHLIDIVNPDYEFNVFEYQQRFYRCFTEIAQRGILPIVVGGTGLYLEAIIEGYDMVAVPEDSSLREKLNGNDIETLEKYLYSINPKLHNTTDLLDKKRLIRAIEIAEYTAAHKNEEEEARPEVHPFVIGIRWDRSVLRERIAKRLEKRLSMGMIDEVKGLRTSGLSWEKLDFFGLEYRYISRYLRGEMELKDMVTTLGTKIGRFAKRQETWFRRMERRGTTIHWVDDADYRYFTRLVHKHVIRNEIE